MLKSAFCRVSTVVVQRFCKPLVGSSNLSLGTAFIGVFVSVGSTVIPENSPYYRKTVQ